MVQPANDITFSADRLKKLSEMESWHFWFSGRQVIVDNFLREYLSERRGRILDIGCGTGVLIRKMMHMGYDVCGLDLRPEGLLSVRRNEPEIKLIQSRSLLPLRRDSLTGVLALDVLEHMDDVEMLTEIFRVLKSGGIAILSVPAHPWLWSFRDVAAGHRRRYTRAQLGLVIRASGLQIVNLNFYQFFLLPFLILTRLFGRRGPALRDWEERPPRLLNKVLTVINRFEAHAGGHLPTGSSLMAVCQKP